MLNGSVFIGTDLSKLFEASARIARTATNSFDTEANHRDLGILMVHSECEKSNARARNDLCQNVRIHLGLLKNSTALDPAALDGTFLQQEILELVC